MNQIEKIHINNIDKLNAYLNEYWKNLPWYSKLYIRTRNYYNKFLDKIRWR